MADENCCPVCEELGERAILVLRQINADEALYVCSNPECPYPIGLTSPEDVVVKREVPELHHHAHNQATGGDVGASPAVGEIHFDQELDDLLTSLLEDLPDTDTQNHTQNRESTVTVDKT